MSIQAGLSQARRREQVHGNLLLAPAACRKLKFRLKFRLRNVGRAATEKRGIGTEMER